MTLPLFCGEQTVKLTWSNARCVVAAVVRVVRIDCESEGIRLTLSWDDLGRDFELHLVKQGGRINDNATDCTWTSCLGTGPDWGTLGDATDNPRKYVDNTGAYGPENIYYSAPEDGTYTVLVEHWGAGTPDSDGQVVFNVAGVTTCALESRLVGHDHALCGDLLHDACVDGLHQVGGSVIQPAHRAAVQGNPKTAELTLLSVERRAVDGASHHNLSDEAGAVSSLVGDPGRRRGRDDELPASTGKRLLNVLLTFQARRHELVDNGGTSRAHGTVSRAAAVWAGARRGRHWMLDGPLTKLRPSLLVVPTLPPRLGAIALRRLAFLQRALLRGHRLALFAIDLPEKCVQSGGDIIECGLEGQCALVPLALVVVVGVRIHAHV